MILIFGGTTEGRMAVAALDEAGSPYYYSTRGTMQDIVCRHGIRISGAMDCSAIETFCREKGIALIVDAAHPFASQLHSNIAEAAERLHIDVIRVERSYTADCGNAVMCRDYNDVMERMRRDGVKRLLALTGVQTIGRLKPFWSETECFFRVLDRDESRQLAASQGFPAERLLFYNIDSDEEAIVRTQPDAVITKESGESGGFAEKLSAAEKHGVKVYVVCRPPMPQQFITVTGRHGLRREVEKRLPSFFPLRSGYTTGSCATAAALAALKALTDGETGSSVEITLPDGEHIEIPVKEVSVTGEDEAVAAVTKDGGDDPDITHGHDIVASVRYASHEGISIYGGKGVGTVTLPGLGLPVGSAAINKTPRQMIEANLKAVYGGGLDVTISVPDGEELAGKTFNPKIGITGGISIIGTSGIVKPFSAEAFVNAIKREIEVAIAIGCDRIVINSGAKSERFVKSQYPGLPPQAFIHYGNFIGDTIAAAASLGVKRVDMGIMIGKAVKLAEGNLDTHSKKVVMNRTFIAGMAADAGCTQRTIERIAGLNLARELWELPDTADSDRIATRITSLCAEHCSHLLPEGILTVMLIDEEGKIRCSRSAVRGTVE